jgi:hypothetical protein
MKLHQADTEGAEKLSIYILRVGKEYEHRLCNRNEQTTREFKCPTAYDGI